MRYHHIFSTGVAILQSLVCVQAQSNAADCSDPAGITSPDELMLAAMIYCRVARATTGTFVG